MWKMTPLWPKANSECERFMKSIFKAIRAVHVEHNNWKQEMYNFLRNFRATPHATLKKAPAEFYFQGILRLDNLKLQSNLVINSSDIRTNTANRM